MSKPPLRPRFRAGTFVLLCLGLSLFGAGPLLAKEDPTAAFAKFCLPNFRRLNTSPLAQRITVAWAEAFAKDLAAVPIDQRLSVNTTAYFAPTLARMQSALEKRIGKLRAYTDLNGDGRKVLSQLEATLSRARELQSTASYQEVLDFTLQYAEPMSWDLTELHGKPRRSGGVMLGSLANLISSELETTRRKLHELGKAIPIAPVSKFPITRHEINVAPVWWIGIRENNRTIDPEAPGIYGFAAHDLQHLEGFVESLIPDVSQLNRPLTSQELSALSQYWQRRNEIVSRVYLPTYERAKNPQTRLALDWVWFTYTHEMPIEFGPSWANQAKGRLATDGRGSVTEEMIEGYAKEAGVTQTQAKKLLAEALDKFDRQYRRTYP